MFGFKPQNKMQKKLKKEGKKTVGKVTQIGKHPFADELSALFGNTNDETQFVITYQTDSGTAEEMIISSADSGAYCMGQEVPLWYAYFGDHYFAMPETCFEKK